MPLAAWLLRLSVGIAAYNYSIAQDDVGEGGQEFQCAGNGMAGEVAFHALQKEVRELNEKLTGQKEQLDKILDIISGPKEHVSGIFNGSNDTHVNAVLPQHTAKSRVVGNPVLPQKTDRSCSDGMLASICFCQNWNHENSAQGQSGRLAE
jgi:hypothetical protein